MRWAMAEQLRRPPPLFHDVVLTHFSDHAEDLLARAEQWASEAEQLGPPAAASGNDVGVQGRAVGMRAACEELRQLLGQAFLSHGTGGAQPVTASERRWALVALALALGGVATGAVVLAVYLRAGRAAAGPRGGGAGRSGEAMRPATTR